MNNSHTKIYAAAGAQFCGYSLVRRIAAGCLIAAASMSAAQAGPRDKEAQRASQMQQREAFRERMQAAPQQGRGDQRQFDSREFEARAEEQRRNLQIEQEQNANAEAFRRSGRLTPDERRDLRRQINEAGNEIYPDRRRR